MLSATPETASSAYAARAFLEWQPRRREPLDRSAPVHQISLRRMRSRIWSADAPGVCHDSQRWIFVRHLTGMARHRNEEVGHIPGLTPSVGDGILCVMAHDCAADLVDDATAGISIAWHRLSRRLRERALP